MQIVWTEFAIESLKQIFDYYAEKASKKVAHKIKNQILESVHQLINNPESGQIEFNLAELNTEYRYLVTGNYKLIYRISESKIVINDVFDVRQNPTKMKDEKRLHQ